MTKQERTKFYLGVPAFTLTLGALVFWLLSAAFVPHREFNEDQRRQDLATDSLRNDRNSVSRDIEDLKRIGCASLSAEQKQIARACP